MRRELRLGLGGGERDLGPAGLFRFQVVRVREAEFLGGAALPGGEVRGGDPFHAVDLDVERLAAGEGVLDPGSGCSRSGLVRDTLAGDLRPDSLVCTHFVDLVQVDSETACSVEPPGTLRAAEVLGLLVAQQDALVLEGTVTVLRAAGC